jgi:branched-chain amino acid transport system ATP-binding protein
MTMLRVEGAAAFYGKLQALEEINVCLEGGDVLAVLGANGAGKSTLLSLISGELKPSSGKIFFNDVDITRLDPFERVRIGIALVPEGRHLFPSLTVEENLLVGGATRRKGLWSLEAVYDLFPFVKERRNSRGGQLSGGEQQAVAIGRALMSNPSLLLLDEVSLGLAPIIVRDLYEGLRGVIRQGTATLLVEQDLTEALGIANQVLCLLDGRVVLRGSPESLSKEQMMTAYFGETHGGLETTPEPQ